MPSGKKLKFCNCANWSLDFKNEAGNCQLDLDLEQCSSCDMFLEKAALNQVPNKTIQQVAQDISNATITNNEEISKRSAEMLSKETSKIPTFMEKVVSASKFVASKFSDDAPSQEVQEARLNVCRTCKAFSQVDDPNIVGYCKACGCGRHKFSALKYKATAAVSTCPYKLWDVTVNETPPVDA